MNNINIITNKVKVMRVSKTSFKEWVLYGAVDQALKTSCQADAVKVVPIQLTVHDEPMELELWLNADELRPFSEDEPNPPAQVILQQRECAAQGTNRTEMVLAGYDLPETPLVKGVAILTGPGCSEFPDDHVPCTLAALVGQLPDRDVGDDDD